MQSQIQCLRILHLRDDGDGDDGRDHDDDIRTRDHRIPLRRGDGDDVHVRLHRHEGDAHVRHRHHRRHRGDDGIHSRDHHITHRHRGDGDVRIHHRHRRDDGDGIHIQDRHILHRAYEPFLSSFLPRVLLQGSFPIHMSLKSAHL